MIAWCMANDDQTGDRAGHDSVAASLTPFSAPLRVAAEAALAEIIRAWLAALGGELHVLCCVPLGHVFRFPAWQRAVNIYSVRPTPPPYRLRRVWGN